jgi:hypothetical protein
LSTKMLRNAGHFFVHFQVRASDLTPSFIQS